MKQQPSLKELLNQDIKILYERFISLQLDDEERTWHLKRYFNRLDTSQPDVNKFLKEALSERLAAIKDKNSEDYAIYHQFLSMVP